MDSEGFEEITADAVKAAHEQEKEKHLQEKIEAQIKEATMKKSASDKNKPKFSARAPEAGSTAKAEPRKRPKGYLSNEALIAKHRLQRIFNEFGHELGWSRVPDCRTDEEWIQCYQDSVLLISTGGAMENVVQLACFLVDTHEKLSTHEVFGKVLNPQGYDLKGIGVLFKSEPSQRVFRRELAQISILYEDWFAINPIYSFLVKYQGFLAEVAKLNQQRDKNKDSGKRVVEREKFDASRLP